MTNVFRKQIFTAAHAAAKRLSGFSNKPYAVLFREELKLKWNAAKFYKAPPSKPVAVLSENETLAKVFEWTEARKQGEAKLDALQDEIRAAECHMSWEAFKAFRAEKNALMAQIRKEMGK